MHAISAVDRVDLPVVINIQSAGDTFDVVLRGGTREARNRCVLRVRNQRRARNAQGETSQDQAIIHGIGIAGVEGAGTGGGGDANARHQCCRRNEPSKFAHTEHFGIGNVIHHFLPVKQFAGFGGLVGSFAQTKGKTFHSRATAVSATRRAQSIYRELQTLRTACADCGADDSYCARSVSRCK
jgi:hypothetical protein